MLLGEGIINMLDVISNDACPNRRGGWRCFKSKYIDELHLHKTLWMKYNIYRLVGVRKCCFRMGKHILYGSMVRWVSWILILNVTFGKETKTFFHTLQL